MSYIRETVKLLIKKHKTNDPFEIAEKLNIIVAIRYMHDEINGFYKLYKRNRFIVINKNLSNELQYFVCSHELGHAVLHPKSNTPFLRNNTFYSVDKIEVEANTFAVELLLPDEMLEDYRFTNLSIEEIAVIHGIPREVARLKTFGSVYFF